MEKVNAMGKNVLLICLVVIAAGALAALAFGHDANASTPRSAVVVSFNPIYYLVRPVVGSGADILQLIGPGVEPHDYEPTPSDAQTLSQGSTFFYASPTLESWATQLVQSANRNMTLVPLIDAINRSALGPNASTLIATDPHFWLDPALMPGVVRKIETTMAAADPANASTYAYNANAFITQLSQLDDAYRTGLGSCKSRTLLDSHAFLGYLAVSYNLTEISIGGQSPDAEVSPQHLISVVSEATKDHARAVFQESADPTAAVDQNVAAEINGTIYKIYTLEILSQQQIAGNASYVTLMYDNLRTLKEGLNCT
ncbi:Zinc-uptake complex component A periplasmic [uncultured archaeon]|nr:Zinc-uptake complex component A periplasmic [uncultured archaeon]